ncbi:MAG: deoxynucleoside kinase [Armatimonadota bacterium]|nr:deoxynucleoside kinase [Armatimonadota bacterium]MDR7437483.1 deoxynucleoside kinase [Armatimonadota bacterium]MDR7472352.1 deoxynucleoside kinase [Armatimonadota bacterium]MDR7506345.1 deoxynucleoside kinase [Armatimonadota bacterium]MDR7508440.1 deoxynucleoside kinase [Armatimonadota bacterium]
MNGEGLVYRPPPSAQEPLLPEGVPVVAVEGPIGVGKTTLARRLGEALEAEVVLEVVEENPFLSRFYEDIRAVAFQTQIFFLLSRFRQQEAVRQARARGVPVVTDYIFAKDRLFARLTLDPQEMDLYDRVYAALAPRAVTPSLVVYLRASLPTLLERIARRGRPFERALQPAYLARLCQAYDEFFDSYGDAPVLQVDTDRVDIFSDADLRAILAYVARGTPRVQ